MAKALQVAPGVSQIGPLLPRLDMVNVPAGLHASGFGALRAQRVGPQKPEPQFSPACRAVKFVIVTAASVVIAASVVAMGLSPARLVNRRRPGHQSYSAIRSLAVVLPALTCLISPERRVPFARFLYTTESESPA